MTEMLLRIRKSQGWNKHKQIYEMNFGTNKWYDIHRRNISLKGPARLERNFFNAMIAGLVTSVKGRYDRARKQLRLKL